jgi:hypothetical protein
LSLVVTLLFAAHLLCVNVASAGPLVAVLLDWLEGRGSRLAGEAGRYLSCWALGALPLGGLLGLAIGAIFWNEHYQAVLTRLSSKVHFGAWELLFSAVLMLAHVWWWKSRPAAKGWERGARMFVALLASTNLLYHFPTLFAVVEQLATSPAESTDRITASDFRVLLVQPAILSRSIHFVLAAIATAGIVLLGYALRLARRKGAEADVQQVAAWGAQIALVPTLVQMPVGLWLAASLAPLEQASATGGDMITTCMLLGSIGLAIWLMQMLAAISIGDAERTKLIKAMALMVVIIVLMSGVLQRLREVRADAGDPLATFHPAPSAHTILIAGSPLPLWEIAP